jgi:hypothetical protein
LSASLGCVKGSSIASEFPTRSNEYFALDVTIFRPIVGDISMSSVGYNSDMMKVLYDGSCMGPYNQMVIYFVDLKSASRKLGERRCRLTGLTEIKHILWSLIDIAFTFVFIYSL